MIYLTISSGDRVWFGVASEQEKIHATTFDVHRETVFYNLINRISVKEPVQYQYKSSVFSERVLDVLKDTFFGRSVSHNLRLATEQLSDYALRTIRVVSTIPFGYVTTYGLISNIIGGSPRAVGQVMASNPFPLIVPCHRVVRSNFELGGYGFGLDIKLEILRRENEWINNKNELIKNVNLQIFPVAFVLRKVNKKIGQSSLEGI